MIKQDGKVSPIICFEQNLLKQNFICASTSTKSMAWNVNLHLGHKVQIGVKFRTSRQDVQYSSRSYKTSELFPFES